MCFFEVGQMFGLAALEGHFMQANGFLFSLSRQIQARFQQSKLGFPTA